MSRYLKRQRALNKNVMYDKLLEKRGVKQVVQYRSPTASFVTDEELEEIEAYDYYWKFGDTFQKLASDFYGDPKVWYVIAGFNRKPTESHVSLGERIRIPVSLADALQVVE
jgi:nucleoid-associated protein YgaU